MTAGRTNATFLVGGGSGSLAFLTATELPEAALGTACILVDDAGSVTEDILVQTTEPAHASGRVWVEIENAVQQNIVSDSGGSAIRLKRAWQSNGSDWVPCNAYYTMFKEWVQFSWAFSSFGVEWYYGATSPLLTRIGDAAGLEATASVGAVAGHSDFDTVPIFGEIRRCNLANNGVVNAYEGEAGYAVDGSNGQVMVEIPKFYYKVENDTTNSKYRYYVSNAELDGFAVHGMFLHNGGVQDHVYVGAYKTSANYCSISGAAPLVSQTRAATRTGIRGARGSQWSLVDVATRCGIGMLMVVEFANLSVQASIGPGYTNSDNSAAINAGSCDNVAGTAGRPSGTGDKVDVIWRGIEGWWGNVWEWIDGFNINGGVMYYCLNQEQFADDTTTNYAAMGITVGTSLSSSYSTRLAAVAGKEWLTIPNAHSGGSDASYLADACWSSTGWRVAGAGGWWDYAGTCGAFCWSWYIASSYADADVGGRLLYCP